MRIDKLLPVIISYENDISYLETELEKTKQLLIKQKENTIYGMAIAAIIGATSIAIIVFYALA
jgi:predicted nucleotidyltransferase